MSTSPDRTVVSQGGSVAATVTTCTTCGAALATSDAACPQCGVGRGSPHEQAERMRLRLQAQLGDTYELVELLGRGGMGIVFRARERALDRDVALKVLALDPVLAPEAWARFEREAKLAAKLDHPHIVPVYAVGQGSGVAYYTMRLVRGGSVEDLLADRRPLDVASTLETLRAVAAALDYAHRNGVVHRDVKPANILLQDGHAMVADFGIAKALEAGEHAANLTGTGVIGSPAYMSPEQWRGDMVDGRADQYALGVVAFEMLTGRRPFETPRVQDLFKLHQSAPVPDATQLRRGLDPGVQQALERALAKYPSERFPSATAFVDALAARRPVAMPSGRAPAAASPGARAAARPTPQRRGRRRVVLPLVITLAAAGIAAAWAPPTRPWVRGAASEVVARADAFLNPSVGAPRRSPAPDSIATVAAAAPLDSSAVPGPTTPDSATTTPATDERLPIAPLSTDEVIPANFRMAPRAAVSFVRVVTRGGSARVRIDGRTLGFTPYVARVEPGMHYVSVEGAGDTFMPAQHAVDATDGDTLEAVFTAPSWSPPVRAVAPATPPAPPPVPPASPATATSAPAPAPDSASVSPR